MKKSFLLLAGAAAVLASCSKTETTDRPQGSAIGFAGAWIGHAVESKAQNDANITTEEIDHFFVFGGYDGFNNVFRNGGGRRANDRNESNEGRRLLDLFSRKILGGG